jgi:serine/threonine protein kinase
MGKLLVVADSPWSSILRDQRGRLCYKVCRHEVPPHDATRELAILVALRNAHPNIIHLLGSDKYDDGALRLIMPYYEHTLLSFLKSNPQSVQEKAELLAGLADGLAFIHHLKIMHRDINPSNVLIKKGNKPQAIICDFGVSWCVAHAGKEKRNELICQVGTG